MKVSEIFVPNDTPTVTYVDRSEHKLEGKLRDLYETPNIVVSISGPTKSGKTVLLKKVVPEDYLITVRGASISTADDLWDRVLNWMGTPNETTQTKGSGTDVSGSVEGGGKLKLPFFGEAEAKGSSSLGKSWNHETSETRGRRGLDQVIDEIAKSEFAIFVDDFHYINPDIRDDIGRQIKAAAESGVKIFTASVPHRADDVVRSNPELRGRVAAIDMEYWSVDELIQIPRKGFAALNAEIAPAIETALATEAFGSPQLMQTVCLNLCRVLNVRAPLEKQARIEVSKEDLEETLLATSDFANFSKMISALHTGAKTRGTERKIHAFTDGSKGDVYRSVLLAIGHDPARLSFSYDEIMNRIKLICPEDAPVGSSVSSALEQMAVIANEVQPGTSPIAWDEDVLDISDPYFLFYIRCSSKLSSLG